MDMTEIVTPSRVDKHSVPRAAAKDQVACDSTFWIRARELLLSAIPLTFTPLRSALAEVPFA